MDFHEELAHYGPTTDLPRVGLAEARAYCVKLATSHYENFSVLTWLTPRPARPHFAAIYAFCRWSDDLGDEVGDLGVFDEALQQGTLTMLFEELLLSLIWGGIRCR